MASGQGRYLFVEGMQKGTYLGTTCTTVPPLSCIGSCAAKFFQARCLPIPMYLQLGAPRPLA